MEKDISTEEKIKEAARKLFQQKGFKGTRSRDIAEEAGLNLALLNYYFRSKEKLFDIIMSESVAQLFSHLLMTINNPSTTLMQKVESVVNYYIDILSQNPNLPMFVLGEIHSNPEKFIQNVNIPKGLLNNSVVLVQIKEQMQKAGLDGLDPLHIMMNVISMSILPVIGKPMLKTIHFIDEEAYQNFLTERRTLIPLWIKTMLKIED